MDAIEAKTLMESGKENATTELLSKIDAAISSRASKGWNRADLTDIVLEYNFPIINDAYNRLRANGFNVNVMTHTAIW